jgi:hypothetical protein
VVSQLAAFGISTLLGNLLRVICITFGQYLTFHRLVSLPKLQKIQEKNQQVYILGDMRKIFTQLSYLSVPKYFVENIQRIYLLVFVSKNAVWMGDYTLISHLGGLVVIFIYSPIEQICYNLFSREFSDYYLSQSKYSNKIHDGEPEKTSLVPNPSEDSKISLDFILSQFSDIMKCSITFFGLLICYGIPYRGALLPLLFGEKWATEKLFSA